MNKVLIITALSLLTLAGCRDDSSSQRSEESDTTPALTPANNYQTFEKEMKRHLIALGSVQTPPSSNTLPPSNVDDEAADGAGATTSMNFSSTNVQEAGVDESDNVKFDGRFLYVTKRTGYGEFFPVDDVVAFGATEDSPNENAIRILDTTSTPPGASELTSIPLGDQSVTGMYLSEHTSPNAKQLTVLSSKQLWNYYDWYDFGYWGGNSTLQIDIFNVTDPANPDDIFSVNIDGTYIDSRRIDNKVYIVSRYYPQIDAFVPYPMEESVARNNAAIVDALDVKTLLPQRRTNGGSAGAHVTADDCLMPAGSLSDNVYMPFILTVTTVDLDNPSNMDVTCMVGESSGLYATTTALYVYDQSDWVHTVVHKFNLANEGARYRSSGEIDGNIGWNQPHLRFSEYNGDLRVMSTDTQQNHHLSVLRDDNATPPKLSVIATLPNASQPAPIGKPNEALYGVRFLGTRAYAVTFERTDPLYVLDLSNPLSPTLAGELELPGFSDYLQPLGENLLLGIGKQASQVDGGTLVQGVKVGLFNVTNPNAPQVLDEQIIGKRGTDSAAAYDYHALSLLQVPNSDRYRVVLPVAVHDGTPAWGEGDWAYYAWQSSLFRFYEIDAAAATPSLQSTGDLVVDAASESQSWQPEYFFRSVISGDNVHAIYGDQVWSASWASPGSATGPQ